MDEIPAPSRSTQRKTHRKKHKMSTSDLVVTSIVDGILSGRYVPGQKLIEADLTEALGISRGPVRESLKGLDAEGLIVLRPHRGAYIRSFTRKEAMDLIVILERLTGLMARLAAQAIRDGADAERVNEAYKWLERFRNGGTRNIGFIEGRRHFYDTLMAIGGNEQFPTVMPTMRIHLLRLQMQPYMSEEDVKNGVNDYASITEAVLAGDPNAAERATRRHIKRLYRKVTELPDKAFPRNTD